MTTPIGNGADVDRVGKEAALSVDELVRRSQALGLVWRLRPATVAVTSDLPMNTQVLVDGDIFPTRAHSLIGALPANARVMLMFVPPQGTYIVGYYGNTAGLVRGYQAGQILVSFGPATSFTQVVTFTQAFAAAPSVHVNIASGAGATANWQSRAITVTTTGFTIFLFGPSATFTNVTVNWSAFPRTQ